MADEVLVVKIKDIVFRQSDIRRIREAIRDQMKEGVVVLPDFMDAIVVPKDIEVRVEKEE